MKIRKLCTVLVFLAWVSNASAVTETEGQVTLYPPRATGTYSEGNACFSFKAGALKKHANGQWDLGYGFANIGGNDWFILWSAPQTRSVIKDLGELKWTDSFTVPVLQPLPKIREGETRHITVDASAKTGKQWEQTTNIMAKVVVGHMYLVRVKDPRSDFYVLFRVEDFKQGEHCTITWKRTAMPRPRRAEPA